MKLLNWVQKALASVFFIGYIPWMPGTIGSALVVAALWYLRFRFHVTLPPQSWWIIAFCLSAFSVAVSSRPREVFGHEDPKPVIIDECAGQFITFLFIPLTVRTLVLGFLVFRFFDIIKPFPVYKMEELESGLGITMDDVVAGVYANICLVGILWVYYWISVWLH
jgi:phosphatidylglycerophosphatase A